MDFQTLAFNVLKEVGGAVAKQGAVEVGQLVGELVDEAFDLGVGEQLGKTVGKAVGKHAPDAVDVLLQALKEI